MTTPDGKDMNVLSETLEKVKKGLGCCSKNVLDPCNGCPYERTENVEWKCGLNADALALIQQLEAQVPKWISVEERQPEWDEKTLVCVERPTFSVKTKFTVDTAFYIGNGVWQYKFEKRPHVTYRPKYWMPLPKPPKEE